MQSDDHVWRWRNEQAGYHQSARRSWREMWMRDAVRIDINAMDSFDPVHSNRVRHDRADDDMEAIRNGDTAIY